MKCFVYLGASIDGYIAGKNGELDWLEMIPNPDQIDMGYSDFMSQIDALVMGRNSFDMIIGFDIDWPYEKPVFVLSNSMKEVPADLQDKVFIINGTLNEVLEELSRKGYSSLYIDGGKTVQSFLKEDLVDELIITTIPIVLGDGIPLFGNLERSLKFDLVSSKVFLDQIVQRHYSRKREKTIS